MLTLLQLHFSYNAISLLLHYGLRFSSRYAVSRLIKLTFDTRFLPFSLQVKSLALAKGSSNCKYGAPS